MRGHRRRAIAGAVRRPAAGRTACVLLLTLLSLLLLGAAAGPAQAHAALLRTAPGDNEILPSGPDEVTLTFAENVSIGLGNLKVVTADGQRVDTGAPSRSDGDTVVHIPVRSGLADGSYVVLWRVVSADAHPVSGAFTFSVGAPSLDTSALLGRGNITSIAPNPRAPGIALGTARFLGHSALVVLLGGALFALLLWPSGVPRVRRLLLAAGVVEAGSAAAALLLQGPYASGNPLSSVTDTALLRAVAPSQYGVATLARTALSLLAIGAVLALRRPGRAGPAVVSALSVGIAGCWSAAGHAGVGIWQPFTYVSDVVHLVSASAWVGGLVVLGLGLRRWWDDADQARVLPGWSRVAFWSVVALVASGTFASLREVGELAALVSTTYGRLLVAKVALVGLMLLLALVGRAYVRAHHGPARSPVDAEDAAGLRRSTALESALSVGALLVTAVLVNTTPAKAAFAPPYSGRSAAGPLTVQVDVYPARRGLNGLHVYTVGAGGRTVDVEEVTGYVERVGVEGGDRISVDTPRKSLGHYEDLSVVLPAKGTWTITLQVRVSDVDSYPVTQTLTIR